jgi:hypothetical protein
MTSKAENAGVSSYRIGIFTMQLIARGVGDGEHVLYCDGISLKGLAGPRCSTDASCKLLSAVAADIKHLNLI